MYTPDALRFFTPSLLTVRKPDAENRAGIGVNISVFLRRIAAGNIETKNRP